MRKEIEKDEIVPNRVDTVSEMSYGGSSGTENVTKQCRKDHIENPFDQGLIEIMYKGEKGDIPILCSRHITLVTKYPNEVNKC